MLNQPHSEPQGTPAGPREGSAGIANDPTPTPVPSAGTCGMKAGDGQLASGATNFLSPSPSSGTVNKALEL